ncbi:MAG: tRNA (adenosine(37)-N6)-dimethylallyltransferase MiaA [Elusimicrobiaceae bacterium]|nr:tRNA (adenosine(37)-N6)-dimethylallyltransferase MiaA [Elusimicrobiaceae bacterium]
MKPIVICGPTASGKTDLALSLARQTGGLILSADSRQVYKHLTIGTAKPQGTYQNGLYTVDGVPYLLVDFVEVTDTFNAGSFCARVREIAAQFPDKPLIFAGGTGMYLHAYFVGMDDLPPSTEKSRAQLTTLLAKYGKEGMHQLLAQKDPDSAAQIPPGNIQRTMRALELCLLTGKPASELKSGAFFELPDPEQSHWVYLDWDKDLLNARIAARTEQIFDGMCAEAHALLAQGFDKDIPALKTLGYPQAVAYLQHALSRAQAVADVALKTRQYAKRQRTWFNRYTQAQRLPLNAPQDFDTKKLTQAVLARVSK